MKGHIIAILVSLKYLKKIPFMYNTYNELIMILVLGKFTEPIYENVPLPWNSKETRGRAQSVPEVKTPPKVLQQVQPVKEEIIVEKQKNEMTPIKNSVLDMSTSSNVSSQVTSTSIIHSADHSFGIISKTLVEYVIIIIFKNKIKIFFLRLIKSK